MSLQNQKLKRKGKKHKKHKGKKGHKLRISTTGDMHPDYDDDISPPPSPGPYDNIGLDELDEPTDSDDTLEDNSDEISDDLDDLHDDKYHGSKNKKKTSMDDYYTKRSQSTDTDDINNNKHVKKIPSLEVGDVDIDVQDYDWSQYKGPENDENRRSRSGTQGDKQIQDDLDRIGGRSKSPKQERPHSARGRGPSSSSRAFNKRNYFDAFEQPNKLKKHQSSEDITPQSPRSPVSPRSPRVNTKKNKNNKMNKNNKSGKKDKDKKTTLKSKTSKDKDNNKKTKTKRHKTDGDISKKKGKKGGKGSRATTPVQQKSKKTLKDRTNKNKTTDKNSDDKKRMSEIKPSKTTLANSKNTKLKSKRSSELKTKTKKNKKNDKSSRARSRSPAPRSPVPRGARSKSPRGARTRSKSPVPRRVRSPKDEDDHKDPEVLDRARGQSLSNIATGKNDEYKETEYEFASQILKSMVPKDIIINNSKKNEKPRKRLILEHVIGYTGNDNLCRNNLYSLKKQNDNVIVYNVSSVAVVHNLDNNTQIIYQDHDGYPITSLTVHPKINYIATSAQSTIRVWDPQNLDSLPEISCKDIKGDVRHLNFSPISTLLFFVCNDNKTLMAFKLQQRDKAIISCNFDSVISKSACIYGLTFNPSPDLKRYIDQFIIYGNNILYWCQTTYFDGKRVPLTNINEKSLTFKYSKIHKLSPNTKNKNLNKEKAYQCGIFVGHSRTNDNINDVGYYVLGGNSGTIYFGFENTIIAAINGHNGRVQCLLQHPLGFISIGYDGLWKIWKIDYKNDIIIKLSKLIAAENVKQIKKQRKQNKRNNNNNNDNDDKKDDNKENERTINDYSDEIIKTGAISIICEDSFVPNNDCISKHVHSSYYDLDKDILYIGTICNEIISVSNINIKTGENDLEIISTSHGGGIVGVAKSPKLESIISTISEDGLLRLWNLTKQQSTNNKNKNKNNKLTRKDQCVGWQSLISTKQQQLKLKISSLAWSPDGKYIACGYNVSRVALCTAHPLKKVQEIDLTQYKHKGKQIKSTQSVNALCFSYTMHVLAVGHSSQLSLFNVANNKRCIKWDTTLSIGSNISSSYITHLYFSQDDTQLCVITNTYNTRYYNISINKRKIVECTRPCKPDIVWWPRIPLTSYILKGLYVFNNDDNKYVMNPLIDADICESLNIVASCDAYGVIRIHDLPALNANANNQFKHHCGKITNVLFVPNSMGKKLISVGKHDQSIFRWVVEEVQSMI